MAGRQTEIFQTEEVHGCENYALFVCRKNKIITFAQGLRRRYMSAGAASRIGWFTSQPSSFTTFL
uniref:hypothetical protein n=1 Tax=Prevotella sp. TaxID=59823 RepID=UPI003FEF8DE1